MKFLFRYLLVVTFVFFMFLTLSKSEGNYGLYAFGYNYYGQLGDGTNIDRFVPVRIGSDADWAELAHGAYHSVGIKSDGTLWAWGRNNDGQLGDGTYESSYTPIQIGFDNHWKLIAVGETHNIAIKSDGTLWSWSYNSNIVPEQIGTDTDWIAISAGGNHNLAIKSNGTLWSWGSNLFGQVGDGTYTNIEQPKQIGTDTNWEKVAAGMNHSLAIKSDGTLWAWGWNYYGQNGDGKNDNILSPKQIGRETNWKKIAAGHGHSLAIKNNGTLWAWGFNAIGQIGDGTLSNRNVPKQIGTDSDWSFISAGYYQSYAIKNDSTLWDWGGNDLGGLGLGSSVVYRVRPTKVGIYHNWVKVTSGSDAKNGFALRESTLPIIGSTKQISNITSSSATSGGEVLANGGETLIARGVCWSLNPNPTISNDNTNNGTGVGKFTSSLTGLTKETRYYVRAYATNLVGTVYGEERTFSTDALLPIVSAPPKTTGVTKNSAVSGGEVLGDGGAEVTERGICISISRYPNVHDRKFVADEAGVGAFTIEIDNLSPATKYYLRIYAINSVGTVYSTERTFTTPPLPPGVY